MSKTIFQEYKNYENLNQKRNDAYKNLESLTEEVNKIKDTYLTSLQDQFLVDFCTSFQNLASKALSSIINNHQYIRVTPNKASAHIPTTGPDKIIWDWLVADEYNPKIERVEPKTEEEKLQFFISIPRTEETVKKILIAYEKL